MCGIIGFVGNDAALAKKMAEVLHHRGPDGEGFFADESFTLGHRRLAVIDLSPRGAQPMWTSDKTLGIIFNGEIYNFKKLRADLEKSGERFVSDSDTEVILLGFKREGKEFFSKMRGMWAVALYDTSRKEITIARDPFGIKPLYYLQKDGHFAFASEMKALNAYAKEKKIQFSFSPEGCASFFTLGYSIHPFTVFKEIKKLEPGGVVTYSLQQGMKYFSKTKWGEVNIPQTLDDALKDSVQHHLIADVPVGIFLSGGVDSVLIALMLKELNTPLKAFTVSMEGRDDAVYAAKIAQFAGLQHYVIPLTKERLKAAYERLFDTLDEPVADPGILPSLVVSEEARKHVTCVLSGEGGDELFLGYERYQSLRGLSTVSKSSGFLGSLTGGFKAIMRRLSMFEARIRNDLLQAYVEHVALGVGDRQAFLPEIRKRFAGSGYSASFFDEKVFLPDDLLYKTDIATMAHSLEVRTPFLDSVVSAFSRTIPDDQKYGNVGKLPLRELLLKRLPKDLIMPGKLGFGVPRATLNKLIEVDIAPSARTLREWRIPGVSDDILKAMEEIHSRDRITRQYPLLPFSLVVLSRVVSQYDVQNYHG